MLEVTDDKKLAKAERKRRQIENAARAEPAKLVKLADKICNLRDVATRPPHWDLARRRKSFDWAKRVVDGLRGVTSEEIRRLEAVFDAAYAMRK